MIKVESVSALLGEAVNYKNSLSAACRSSEADRRSAFAPSSLFLCFVSFGATKEMKGVGARGKAPIRYKSH
jgi:hypothetical protein